MQEETSKRIKREIKTVKAMLTIYCKHHHTSGAQLCEECASIYEYAVARLHRCPFQTLKPTCGKCLIHCYNKDMQQKIRAVMRYSGPRLLLVHPILALYHILDSRIQPQQRPKKKS
ncbi:nitrous oxide-stimulated promoter family protein [Desulforhopalus sp. IMCC35007]|uniref:nitrous oxide-stimulated promoter family protein n=1 Tax=Desulforhopalus sp. IMCC35007 TaxID=2569543 RepID=UPI0010ADC562|nr:nitrous oxide-stimulated promoter family protein [Desulforhopalus sp. IMCC35007]